MMKTYSIAGITVKMNPSGETLLKQGKDYLIDEDKNADIEINLSDEIIRKVQNTHTYLTQNEIEYIFAGFAFYSEMLKHEGFFLHSSAVSMDNKAYLFSAPCGTGKSTHANLWLKCFKERAKIINDDKPAIRCIDNKFYVYGTPFSGKTDLNLNIKVPLAAICILERSETNRIEKIDAIKATYHILNQTLRPKEEKDMDILLKLIDKMLKVIPVYKLGCNMESEAAIISYSAMSAEVDKNE